MSKLPRNRLDDTLNAILIVVGSAALMSLALDAPQDAQQLARTAVPGVAAQPAPAATPAPKLLAEAQTQPTHWAGRDPKAR